MYSNTIGYTKLLLSKIPRPIVYKLSNLQYWLQPVQAVYTLYYSTISRPGG